MKKLLFLSLCLPLLWCSGCNEYDDQPIRDRIDGIEDRLEYLEDLCRQMNSEIGTLQELVQALLNQDSVQGVTPIVRDGQTVGYTITFTKSAPISIYNGEDGKSASAPVIGVAQEEGVWYWTVDGSWMTAPDGQKISAEGKQGAQGATPQLRIAEGYWELSYDGTTWTRLGQASGEPGEQGDSLFSGVDPDGENDTVVFTLADGTKIALPKAKRLSIELETTECVLVANVPAKVGYTLTGANEHTTVEVMATGAVKARIESRTATGGVIAILAADPAALTEYDKVLVMAADGERSALAAILFENGILRAAQEAYEVPAEGGSVTVAVTTNLDYEVSIAAGAQAWLTRLEESRAVRTEHLQFAVAANEGAARTGVITLKSDEIEQKICIMQAAKVLPSYRIAIPADFTTGPVQQVTVDNVQVAEICQEYIRSGAYDQQMVVIYPMEGDKADLTRGCTTTGLTVVWDTTANTCTVSGTEAAAATTLYIEPDGTFARSTENTAVVEAAVEPCLLVDVRGFETQRYKIAKIGTQYWMAESLRAERYRDGSVIPNTEWDTNEEAGACVSLSNEAQYKSEYGLIYNGFAVLDARGLAPEGWEVSTVDDLTALKNYIGTTNPGAKLKSTTGWSQNKGTNITGFNALPGMYYQPTTAGDPYGGITPEVQFWTSTTAQDPLNKKATSLVYYRFYDTHNRLIFDPDVSSFSVTLHAAAFGQYVRCVRR